MTEQLEQTTQVTTVAQTQPTEVVRKVTTVVPPATPPIKVEHPQQVYETKKVIFRSYQVIWYILGVIEVLLVLRLVLKMVGADPFTGFTAFIYAITAPFAVPFLGVLPSSVSGTSVMEWSTILAIVVYALVAYGIIGLFQFLKPVTPREVSEEVDSV